MKKKGFTLVELLAVIAILAILVIIALPNVLRMFRNAKQNTFASEVQNLIRSAETKSISSSLLNENNLCFDSVTNPLDMTGRDNLKYIIRLSDKGKVIEVKVTDNEYEIIEEDSNGISREEISNKVRQLQEGTSIIGCSGDVIQEGNTLGLPLITFGSSEGSVPSRGYLKNGKLIREDGKTELNKLDEIPSKKGNKFLGYYIPDTDTQIIDEEGNIIEDNLANLSESIDLESKWEANTYTVVYDKNGGTGEMSNSTHTYGVASKLSHNEYKKDGYTFMGWSKEAEGEEEFSEEAEITDLIEEGSITLYAVWKDQTKPTIKNVTQNKTLWATTYDKEQLYTLEITVEAEDKGSKNLLYSIDGGEYQSSNKKLIVTKGKVKIKVKDESGNEEETETNIDAQEKLVLTKGIKGTTDKCLEKGNCAVGTAFYVKVNNSEINKFYIINDDSKKLTLILNRNVGNAVPWISEADYKAAGGTTWQLPDQTLQGNVELGPITALKELASATSGWSNITFSYTLKDVNNRYPQKSMTNVKARLLTSNEAEKTGCVFRKVNSCPSWLIENGSNAIISIWLNDTVGVLSSCQIYDDARTESSAIYYNKGIRPVIEIEK